MKPAAATDPVAASKAVYITIGVLLIFVLSAAFLRSWLSDKDQLPTGDSAWMINVTHQVVVLERGASIYISPPWDTRFSRLFSQSLSHSGLRQKRTRSDNKRDILLVAPETGKYTIGTNFSIHVSSLPRSDPKKLTCLKTTVHSGYHLRRESWLKHQRLRG